MESLMLKNGMYIDLDIYTYRMVNLSKFIPPYIKLNKNKFKQSTGLPNIKDKLTTSWHSELPSQDALFNSYNFGATGTYMKLYGRGKQIFSKQGSGCYCQIDQMIAGGMKWNPTKNP